MSAWTGTGTNSCRRYSSWSPSPAGVLIALDAVLSRAVALVILGVVLLWFIVFWYVLPAYIGGSARA